ncbi:MAG: 50S ribosomal protein L24 [Verrucomicrobia bacterium]|nr:50S ribosomal protein L24 [Verrucomicrobiota bacterium]
MAFHPINRFATRHVKKGDEVVIIAGSQNGKRGKIIEVVTEKDRVIVEGVAMIKKHLRRSQANPQGAIVEREGTVHISNVMKAEEYDRRRAKHGAAPATA